MLNVIVVLALAPHAFVTRLVYYSSLTSRTQCARFLRSHGPRSVLTLFAKESGWNPRAKSKHSTAYGLAQFLNKTWRLVKIPKSSDPKVQIEAFYRYIDQHPRYRGNPEKALAHHRRFGWY